MTSYPALCLKVEGDYQFVFPSEIVHVQSEGSYSIVTINENKKLVVSKKLKEIEAQLPQDIFVRVHHSYLINLIYLHSYGKNNRSEIHLTNGDMIKISRRKRPDFMNRFIFI